ncbi:MAG: histidine phosphatase family protein [Candidatus Pacebacteria bacterium]|nr:histidine phosphatase family protein [Candidatus Paceibacterota bacterium]MBP9851756.1 histidine phosphatase family protein [Candidatus Paceibacterota bacterium]
MLKKVIITRHAESSEDIDPTMHNIKDGKSAGLTDRGKVQTIDLAKVIREKLKECNRLFAYVSPADRGQETWELIKDNLGLPFVVLTDVRIRNLNWGNITVANRSTVEADRYAVGVLNFTFPEGDHTPSYVSAINDLIDQSLVDVTSHTEESDDAILFVTHGFALRVILKKLLRLDEKEFQWLSNPPNCYVIELLYDSTSGSFRETEPLRRMNPI